MKYHDSIRIWRSPYSDFSKDETLHASEIYSFEALSNIAEAGFNGIWVHAILRDIVSSEIFPELGQNSKAHLASLRKVIKRAGQLGIKLYLYAQPPRGLPKDDPFWQQHPEARGTLFATSDFQSLAMCTSEPRVKENIFSMAKTLGRELPELGGLILITASEFMSHCYCHHDYTGNGGDAAIQSRGNILPGCPRCSQRHPSDIVAEIIRLIHKGLTSSNQKARVIAWNWGWSLYETEPPRRILNQIPKDVILMSGFERGGKKFILGKERLIDEYSLSFTGPSERFSETMREARELGLQCMTKLQISTTHELATVPNLPLIGNIFDKTKRMRQMGIKDFLACWNFGNMLTSNTASFIRFMNSNQYIERSLALIDFADFYFPDCDSQQMLLAWEAFEEGMNSYPFCIEFLYFGPVNYAVTLPVEAKCIEGGTMGPSWILKERGDDLNESFGPFTIDEIIEGLDKLTVKWWEGIACLTKSLKTCSSIHAWEELNSARAAGHCFQSTLNIYKAYKLRVNWNDSLREQLQEIAIDEYKHLSVMLPILSEDKRIGFHSECQCHMFNFSSVSRKLKKLENFIS